MQLPTLLLSNTEKLRVEDELEKLYALQDRPLSKEKKAILIDEMEQMGYPFAALMLGIKQLMTEDLKSIKLVTIKDAARRFLEPQDRPRVKCRYCDHTGAVVMVSERSGFRYRTAFACVCANGQEFARVQGVTLWNGQRTQEGRRKERFEDVARFELFDPTILEAKA